MLKGREIAVDLYVGVLDWDSGEEVQGCSEGHCLGGVDSPELD